MLKQLLDLKVIIPVALVGVLSAGVAGFFYGSKAGANRVQVKLDTERAAWEKSFTDQQLAVVKLENEYDVIDWRLKYEFKPKLAAAERRAADISRRLRDYYARDRALSAAPAPATGDDGAGENGSSIDEVDDAYRSYNAACLDDAVRLNWWIERESTFQAVEAKKEAP